MSDITVAQSTPEHHCREFACDFHMIQYLKRNTLVGLRNEDCDKMGDGHVGWRENKYREHACEKN